MPNNNHHSTLERLQQLQQSKPSRQRGVEDVLPSSPPVKPFGSVKSSFWSNPLHRLQQMGTEGDIHTEVHGSGLRNQADRVKAADQSQTELAKFTAQVQQLMEEQEIEQRAERQFQAAGIDDFVETFDAMEVVILHAAHKIKELEQTLEGDPDQQQLIREIRLIRTRAITILRIHVYGLKNQPKGYGKSEEI